MLNKYQIFTTKLYIFYPLYEFVYKNKNFIKHTYLNYDKIKTIMNKHLFILPIYHDKLENLNIEHLWCKQWIKEEKNISFLLNDLHHLYPANSYINALRKHYKFNELKKNKNDNILYINKEGKITNYDYYYCKINKEKELFEPPNESKDIIVRSLIYLMFRYPELTLHKISNILPNHLFLEWFYKNKVQYEELLRNEYVNYYQKNKNIFISYPILIPILFDDSKDVLKNIIKIIPNQIYCLYTSFFIQKNIKLLNKK